MNIVTKELNINSNDVLNMIDYGTVDKTMAFFGNTKIYPKFNRIFYNPFEQYDFNLIDVFRKPVKLDWRIF